MNNRELKDTLNKYILDLESFFSLSGNKNKNEIYESGKLLSKSYQNFKNEYFNNKLDNIGKSHTKLSQEISKLLPIANKISNIKQANQYEKMFLTSLEIYINTITLLYFKSFEEIIELAFHKSEISNSLEKFNKSQKRIKYFASLSIFSVGITLLGLLPQLSIMMATLSLLLIWGDKKLSNKEINNLKEIGLNIKENAYDEIQFMKERADNLSLFSNFIIHINPYFEKEILPALSKLENGERLEISDTVKLHKSIVDSNTEFTKQFGI